MIRAQFKSQVFWLLAIVIFDVTYLIGQQLDNTTPLSINEANIDSLIEAARRMKDLDLELALNMWEEIEEYTKDNELGYHGKIQLLDGELFLTQGETDKGLAALETAKIEFERANNDIGLSSLYFALTIYHKNLAEYTDALQYAYQGVTINEGLGDNYNLAKFFNQICDLFWYQRKWIEGTEYGLQGR